MNSDEIKKLKKHIHEFQSAIRNALERGLNTDFAVLREALARASR